MVNKVKEKPMLSERVRKEKEELLSTPPQIDTTNVKILLEVYEEGKGQPPVILRGRYFNRLCSERGIFIDNNPIVGTLTKYKYGAYPSFETNCRWMESVDEFSLQRGGVHLTEEDRYWIQKGVDYWKDINTFNRTREVILQFLGVDMAHLLKCGVGIEFAPSGFNNGIPDYHRILSKGLKGIIAEIEEEKAKLDIGNFDDFNRWNFYQGAS